MDIFVFSVFSSYGLYSVRSSFHPEPHYEVRNPPINVHSIYKVVNSVLYDTSSSLNVLLNQCFLLSLLRFKKIIFKTELKPILIKVKIEIKKRNFPGLLK
jgi:hypothetical protein